MNVLIRSETNIDGGVTCSSEQLCSGVFVEHPFTECGKFFPLKATILVDRSDIKNKPRAQRGLNTYDELLVPQGHREVSIERNSEVLGVVALIHHNMFQERSLMAEDLSQSSASGG